MLLLQATFVKKYKATTSNSDIYPHPLRGLRQQKHFVCFKTHSWIVAEAAACDPGMKQLTTRTNQELGNFISQLSRKSAAPLQSETQSRDLWVRSTLLKCFPIIHIVTPHKVPWSGRTIIELSWEYPEPHTEKKKNIQAGELLFLKLTLTLCFYLEHSGQPVSTLGKSTS